MSPPSFLNLLRSVGRSGYNLLHWLAQEFLPLPMNTTASSRVISLCRLLGLATIAAITVLCTRGLAHTRLSDDWYVWALAVILATLIGNIVKECAMAVCARIVNSLGIDFYRRGVTINGRP